MTTPTYPNRIRELREADGLSRRKLAVILDIDASTIVRWEQGAPVPDAKKHILAEHFQTSLAHLFPWIGDTHDDEPKVAA